MTSETDRENINEQQNDRDRVLAFLRRYAVNSISYLALESDKTWYFADSVEGVAAYTLFRRNMVICGDPVCAQDDLPDFLNELKTFARRKHYRLIFLFTIAENLPVYRKSGFGYYKGGEEAVFDLDTYDMSGGRAAKVRASFHQARHEGLTVREYCPLFCRNRALETQFGEITDSWMRMKHTSPLKFAIGGIGFDYPYDKRYFYAADAGGTIQGFMVFLPFRRKQGYMVDVMRRRPGCTHGVMELIFHDACRQMKAEGVRYMSFGIAPLANANSDGRKTIFEGAEHYVYENMNFIYGFKPLYVAKAKYAPARWEPVYLVCRPRHMTLSMWYAMVSVLDTKGFGDYVRSFLNYRKSHK